ncbi:hypothetical protein PJP10_20140 [Mycobacterium kansasii]
MRQGRGDVLGVGREFRFTVAAHAFVAQHELALLAQAGDLVRVQQCGVADGA